jgi:phosphatidylserine/phosphatidylglycerophosphate/cardiolipin synthase-like enzyme
MFRRVLVVSPWSGRELADQVRPFLPQDAEITITQLAPGTPDVDLVVLDDQAGSPLVSRYLQRCPVLLLQEAISDHPVAALFAFASVRGLRPMAPYLPMLQPDHLLLVGATGLVPDPELLHATLGSQPGAVHAIGREFPTEVLRQVEAWTNEHPTDLIAAAVPTGLAGQATIALVRRLGRNLLLVADHEPAVDTSASLQLFDATLHDGEQRTVAVHTEMLGRSWYPEQQVATVVVEGAPVGTVALDAGCLSRADTGSWALATDADRPLETLSDFVRVLPTDGAPIELVLLDDVPSTPTANRRWAVATRAQSPRRIGVDAVIHAAAVLPDGLYDDVHAPAMPAVLGRVAAHLRAVGYPVVSPPGPTAEGDTLVDRLHALSGAVGTTADLVWHLDNTEARLRYFELVRGARERIHLQLYMLDEDAIGAELLGALLGAARRGVTVRVVADALWARHATLGLHNPVLGALEATDGIEVHLNRPVEGIEDLKQRNHRKLLVVDGTTAVVSGRNLSDHYYRGFDEVVLTRHTDQGHVPWLDLSAELTGAAVRALEERFASVWTELGGEAYDLGDATGGSLPIWLVDHRGLRDTHTLDAFRLLIEHAREHVYLANTFPLQKELLALLTKRVREGLTVRFFTGHVRPRFAGGDEPFPGAVERDLMTELIHGRLDPLARAGAEVYAIGLAPRATWPDVGRVLPHVHAKWVSVDGRLGAFGSANLDITSAYWEDELLCLLDDPARVGAVEVWLDGFIPSSERFRPDELLWQERAERRGWISEQWPSLLS